MTIRQARREDVAAIVEVYASDPIMRVRESVSDPIEGSYYRAFEEIDRSADQVLLVAEEDGSVIGTVQVTYVRFLMAKGIRMASIEAMFVRPEWAGRRVGSALVEAAMEMAREAGCQGVELTSNKARGMAHKFYGKHGFQATHEGFKVFF